MRSGVFIFIFLICLSVSAQERCGTVAPSTGEFENWLSTKIAERTSQARPLATLYQIPVVVHVFHKGEPIGTGVNLSDERIKAQIDSLTADFRRMNADAINTPSEYSSIAADVEIEFVLAKQDPAGNPTNGINRLRGSRDSYRANSHRPLLRSESYWPAEHYLNIFVLDLQVFLGYASFPLISLEGITNDADDFTFDGVLIDYEYFGVNPSASAFESYGRTLTHEVGHWLGLRHIWGDGNCSVDDFVDDTPLADNDNGGYTSPCDWPNPDDDEVCIMGEPEMFQNYMDYTDDVCMNLFTEGQKTRMRTVMDNAQNRFSLTTSPGLSEPTRFTDDLAATNILSPKEAECSTNFIPMLRLVNYGTNEVTSYDVQLYKNGNPIGGVQSIVTSLAPLSSDTVAFATQSINNPPGSVSFEISNVNGTIEGNPANNTILKAVSATSTLNLPFYDSFEGASQVLGLTGASFPWEVVNAPKETPSNQSLVFKAHQNAEWFGETTIIKTPIMNLQGISSGDLEFSYAYANPPNAFYDGLMVKASIDCGETFPDVIFSSFGPNLATATPTSASFTPANQLEWVDTVLSITEYRDIDGVQFAFVGINGSGNNIYLDDIAVVETNLFENDANAISLNGPLITCAASTEVELRIRNVGSQPITSFTVEYYIDGDTLESTFNALNIPSKSFATFPLIIDNLVVGENVAGAEIIMVNGVTDESLLDNLISTIVYRDTQHDEYPLIVDFESPDNWTVAVEGSDTLWVRSNLTPSKSLRAKGFNASELGKRSWFISPRLHTGGLDSAGLYFRASYASRSGFQDRLQVLMSTDCGESYSKTLLDADSDSLAVSEETQIWLPSNDMDWKEFRLDLSHSFFFNEDIRIAFVFTPGGGNDLYIDDISIRGNEPPFYEDVIRVYPNPAVLRFNLGLNLPRKEPVTIRLLDMSGRIVFEEYVENALNQILEYTAPSQQGLYFINVVGNQFTASQKLFISR
ncbi:choice-of-anchor J domain-containing protein [Ekhidna sp.]|uniref:choice-of-anchor J domain-containing protein n=1 Tax=Ekhidna sp. TaxID=2608089 RepID=UPI0035189F6D